MCCSWSAILHQSSHNRIALTLNADITFFLPTQTIFWRLLWSC